MKFVKTINGVDLFSREYQSADGTKRKQLFSLTTGTISGGLKLLQVENRKPIFIGTAIVGNNPTTIFVHQKTVQKNENYFTDGRLTTIVENYYRDKESQETMKALYLAPYLKGARASVAAEDAKEIGDLLDMLMEEQNQNQKQEADFAIEKD